MKRVKRVIRRNGFILGLIVLISVLSCSEQTSLPSKVYDNQSDYSFMWWKKTIKTGNQIFAIKTNNYTMSFDYPNLAIQDFSILNSKASEEEVLKETNEQSFPAMSPVNLKFGISVNDTVSWCKTTSGRDDDCQLIETGKYFQRRFITNLPDLIGCSPFNSGLEISSWPDRMTVLLKIIPKSDIENLDLLTELSFQDKYSELLENGEVKALKNPADGSGFIIIKSSDATSFTVSGTTVQVKMENSGITPEGKELNSGMIIYSVAANIDVKLKEIVELELQPLVVTANQIAPISSPLDVQYDKDKGWHQVKLRGDNVESDEPKAEPNESNPGPQTNTNHRMERVTFEASNPTNSDKVLRLNFAKGRLIPDGAAVFGVPGISAVFRDTDGNPVGIPVQLSKNWHTGGRSGVDNHYFRGTWYHGLSMITIPAKTTVSLEYTSVNSMWGTAPAASHGQLCLVGWGHNQQWDESAIGAWGETITYEPDLDQTGAPVLDFRPLLVVSTQGKKWEWTGNLGGADFFNYTKMDGKRSWHSRIRTQYKRYSPNYTQVTYAGVMDDNTMDFEYTASLGRSDDYVRGIYKIRMNVLKDTEFKDFVAIQFAAADYHHVKSHALAWGNENGLQKTWQGTIGGEPEYITEKEPANGKVLWFSFTDSEYTSPQQLRFKLANRGMVIRNWKARINGKDDVEPWFAEYNTAGGNYGDKSGIINVTPPATCTSFQAGDYIEAEVELLIFPEKPEDYYGPNKNFAEVLKKKANSWELVYREAIGNDLDVAVSTGKLVYNYPIEIEAVDDVAQFEVTGGLGYVPLTITNVKNYANPELFRKENGEWVKVNQEVHGKDYWQVEYDPKNGAWDMTYNINLDTPNDEKNKVKFKFSIN